ncbi:unnamed protein product [Amoebophrya sp. A25]|nr:unnamed protein product [Amoebophrya sp. A25]|eukprot:GSA25T00026959001.1
MMRRPGSQGPGGGTMAASSTSGNARGPGARGVGGSRRPTPPRTRPGASGTGSYHGRNKPLLERLRDELAGLRPKRDKLRTLVERNEVEAGDLAHVTTEKEQKALGAEAKLAQKEEEFLSFVSASAAEYNAILESMEKMEQETKQNRPLVREQRDANVDLDAELAELGNELTRVAADADRAKQQCELAIREMGGFDHELQRCQELLQAERSLDARALETLHRDRAYLTELRQHAHSIKNHVQVFYVGESAAGVHARLGDGATPSCSSSSLRPAATATAAMLRSPRVTPSNVDALLESSCIANGADPLQHLAQNCRCETSVSNWVKVDEFWYLDDVFRENFTTAELVDIPPWHPRFVQLQRAEERAASTVAGGGTQAEDGHGGGGRNSVTGLDPGGDGGTNLSSSKSRKSLEELGLSAAVKAGATTATCSKDSVLKIANDTALAEEVEELKLEDESVQQQLARSRIAEALLTEEIPYTRAILEHNHGAGIFCFLGKDRGLFEMVAGRLEATFRDNSSRDRVAGVLRRNLGGGAAACSSSGKVTTTTASGVGSNSADTPASRSQPGGVAQRNKVAFGATNKTTSASAMNKSRNPNPGASSSSSTTTLSSNMNSSEYVFAGYRFVRISDDHVCVLGGRRRGAPNLAVPSRDPDERARSSVLQALAEPDVQTSFSLLFVPDEGTSHRTAVEAVAGLSGKATTSSTPDFLAALSSAAATPSAPAEGTQFLRTVLDSGRTTYATLILEQSGLQTLAQALRCRALDSRGGLAKNEHERKGETAAREGAAKAGRAG